MAKHLDAILTSSLGPSEAIRQWLPSVGTVFVHTPLPIQEGGGIVEIAGEAVSLRRVLLDYLGRIRGREIVGISAPDVHLKPDFSSLFQSVEANRMELSWAFYAKTTGETPKFFVLTTSVIPHIVMELNDSVMFTTGEWKHWLHNWLTLRMQPHKYVDFSGLGLVTDADYSPARAIVVADQAKEVSTPIPEPQPPSKGTEMPISAVRRKSGRPKKTIKFDEPTF